MRILYGVQATGNGHITRARAMAKAFAQTNLQVDFLFTGRAKEQLFDMQMFGDYQVRKGLSFVTEMGRVNLLKTVRQAHVRQLIQDIRSLDLANYDLVLNDFEPVSAWAAKLQGKRSIGLSHQAAFSHPVPRTGQDLGSKLVMRFFAPTQEAVGVHWHHFGCPILPPIIDVDMQRHPAEENKILVYLPFEQLQSVTALLSQFSGYHFYIYHPDATDDDCQELHFRELNRETFEHHLQTCAGVIANSGFELPSESLFLGKKLLVKPLFRQFEQESNAQTLQQLELASVMNQLDKQLIHQWLKKDPGTAIQYPNVAKRLVSWLQSGAVQPLAEISKQLWDETKAVG